MSSLNWDDLRVFLMFVKSGNAYDAAHILAVDHTTVRRRIRALEKALSTKLIDAGGKSLVLSEGGEDLYRSLENIEASIAEASRRVSGADVSVAGSVRVGAPDGFGSIFLAPQLVALYDKYPDLVIDLLSISRQFNVASREVDVAVIVSYPPPSRHIIRKLGSANLRAYASADYLEKHEEIRTAEQLANHIFVGYLEDHPFIPAETLERPAFSYFSRASFGSSSIIAQANAVAAGAGIGMLPYYIARTLPNLRQVLGDELIVPVDMFLLIHADLRGIARYRIVADFIAEAVERETILFN